MARAVAGELPELSRTIESAASGDEAAFGRIVAAYDDDMRRVCRFIARDDMLAEDATQVAWSIAWKKLGSLREPERVKPWLVSIAANETKRLLKKRHRNAEVTPDAGAMERPGGVDPATGIDRIDLRHAMAKLDPDDRALLAMRYVAGFDSNELGAAIGLSPSGTRVRLHRLLERLRKDLDR